MRGWVVFIILLFLSPVFFQTGCAQKYKTHRDVEKQLTPEVSPPTEQVPFTLSRQVIGYQQVNDDGLLYEDDTSHTSGGISAIVIDNMLEIYFDKPCCEKPPSSVEYYVEETNPPHIKVILKHITQACENSDCPLVSCSCVLSLTEMLTKVPLGENFDDKTEITVSRQYVYSDTGNLIKPELLGGLTDSDVLFLSGTLRQFKDAVKTPIRRVYYQTDPFYDDPQYEGPSAPERESYFQRDCDNLGGSFTHCDTDMACELYGQTFEYICSY